MLRRRKKVKNLVGTAGTEILCIGIKAVTELFKALSVIDVAVSERDQVVHLLASLPNLFSMLVIALEANSEAMPKIGKTSQKKRDLTCHFCKKPGHFKRKLAQLEASKNAGKPKHAANAAEKEQVPNLTSDDEAIIVFSHALSATSKDNWIIDSGATCHMCNNEKLNIGHKK